jgi:hypothetical protein
MPKRKTKEYSDSNNKTSTEPARDVQHFPMKNPKISLEKLFS